MADSVNGMITDQHLINATRLYKAKRYKDVLEECNLAIQCNIDCVRAYYLKGMALLNLSFMRKLFRLSSELTNLHQT